LPLSILLGLLLLVATLGALIAVFMSYMQSVLSQLAAGGLREWRARATLKKQNNLVKNDGTMRVRAATSPRARMEALVTLDLGGALAVHRLAGDEGHGRSDGDARARSPRPTSSSRIASGTNCRR
jgi:hypothetical protein